MLCEIRADSVHIEGYVNAVERDSNIINVPSVGQCVEQIRAGAFGQALRDGVDVEILENHNFNRKLGSIAEGNLKLSEDTIGLRAAADIYDNDIIDKARRGLIKGWSFGFVCKDDKVENRADNVPRRIVNALELKEVSLIDGNMTPCYVGTLVEVRGQELVEIRDFVDDEIETVDETAEGTAEEERAKPDYSYYDAVMQLLEMRYNPYHDPSNGRFTSGGGGGGGGLLVVPKGQKGKGFYTSAAKQYYTNEKGQARFIWDNKGKQDLEADRETALADMYEAMIKERDLLVNEDKYIAEIENAPFGKLHGFAEGYTKKAADKDDFLGRKYILEDHFGNVREPDDPVHAERRKVTAAYNDAYMRFDSATEALNGAYNAGYKTVKNFDPNRKYRNGTYGQKRAVPDDAAYV